MALARHDYDLQPIGETTYLNVRQGTYDCKTLKLALSANGMGAAWIESRSPNRILFRSLNEQGSPLSPGVRIEDDCSDVLRDNLSIAALSFGYLLVWYDERDSSGIWAQKVHYSGNLIGQNFPIRPDSAGSILGLEAQNHPDGRVLVSWVTNGQYSRGRWLDGLGNFVGEVFEMADPYPENEVIRSLVSFETGGTGMLYQYSNVLHYGYEDETRYFYITLLDSLGAQSGERFQAGWWSYHYDWGMGYYAYHWYSFPSLICFADTNYLSVRKYTNLGSVGYTYATTLYSSFLGNFIVPYGLAGEGNYDLCQLDQENLLYSFGIGCVGLRQYQISTLDSSEQITWIAEPEFEAPQDEADICVQQNGSFRAIYSNYLGSDPQVYTRFFYPTGMPFASDTIASMNADLIPVMTSGG